MIYSVALLAGSALGIAVCLRRFLVVRIVGLSMMPTLADGDLVLVSRLRAGNSIERGDVVVTRIAPDSNLVVKRVIGLSDGPAQPGGHTGGIQQLPSRRGGHQEYFILEGDNPAASAGHRLFGPIARDLMIGIVVARIWPWGRMSQARLMWSPSETACSEGTRLPKRDDQGQRDRSARDPSSPTRLTTRRPLDE
jgi:signal peptidase I